MKRNVRLILLAIVGVALSSCLDQSTAPFEGAEQPQLITVPTEAPPGCYNGLQSSDALWQVCVPPTWNGDLVVWAHGYVSPAEDLALPDDDVEGTPISQIVTGLEYVYATTSYRDNGLVAADAVDDLVELKVHVVDLVGQEPRFSYLVGGSEGALATTLAIESSRAFSGGMPTCGPIGSFRKQVNHFGDFRVVFDYFFPGIMPGSAIAIPPSELDQAKWDTYYDPTIRAAMAADPHAAAQLIRVTGAAVDPADPASAAETAVSILWYSVFATNDARTKLNGNPFGNRWRWYSGSANDWRLNRGVARFRADAAALVEVGAYETTGGLKTPAVTIHTVGDPVVPYWHEPLYNLKTWRAGTRLRLTSIPAQAYGHCEFTLSEVLAGFAILVLRVSLRDLIAFEDVFPNAAAREEFLELAETEGARPHVLVRPRER
jgi:hypothetical protein